MILQKDRLMYFYEKYMFCMGIIGHFMFLFQAYKILSTKSAANVSLEGFLIAFVSIFSWLLYGILKEDKVLVAVNAFGLFAVGLCLASILIFM